LRREYDYFWSFAPRRFALGKSLSATGGVEYRKLVFEFGFKFLPKTIEAILVEAASDAGLNP
jgi:hypothetical protein